MVRRMFQKKSQAQRCNEGYAGRAVGSGQVSPTGAGGLRHAGGGVRIEIRSRSAGAWAP